MQCIGWEGAWRRLPGDSHGDSATLSPSLPSNCAAAMRMSRILLFVVSCARLRPAAPASCGCRDRDARCQVRKCTVPSFSVEGATIPAGRVHSSRARVIGKGAGRA